ncbi:uncharacterized protein LOC110440853 [Mizuhopecten yessoensis]|uniref:uncharacterized protein LOC110440853 n=1 Tax=Mizuhopecten yessoensis TaxID=6573 RepID=UPI000B45CC5E|nr:uncharacterized protein LOC110440853 [Mizuhopecten yessoensis]
MMLQTKTGFSTGQKMTSPTKMTIRMSNFMLALLFGKFVLKAIGDYVEECKSESGDLMDRLLEITLNITEKDAKMERFLKNIEKDEVSAQETATDLPTKEHTADLNKKEIAAIVLTSPLWIPLGIAGMVTVLPVTCAVLKGKQHQKISKYKANKLEHLNRWTEQILKDEYDLISLEYIIFNMLTEKINEKMRNFSKSITNYKNLLKRLDPTKKKKDVIRGYAEMRELCCHLDVILPVLE